MKTKLQILFIICCTSKLSVFGQALYENKMCNNEEVEIAYILDCLKTNRRVDSLIEWNFSSEYENFIIYKHKNRLAFFKIQKDTNGEFLHSITYYKNSFQKIVFLNDKLGEYEITRQARFRVWMSKDKTSVYFSMINPDNLTIWVLTNGNIVYTYSSALVNVNTNQVEVTNDSKN